MDSIHTMNIAGQVPATTRQVYYTGTDALYEGYAVCYDVTASEANRSTHVAKPTLNNCTEFAGVVAPGQTIPSRTSGGTWVNIVSVEGVIARGVNVYTDENLAAGDLLGVIPGEFVLGKCVVGQPVARVLAATDRSTTAGVVNTQFGWIASTLSPADLASKIVRFFDHFICEGAPSTTADIGKFVLSGTSAAASYQDSLAQAESGASNLKGNGVLRLTTNTTNEASIQLNGEPFTLGVGKSLFFRARIASSSIAAAQQAFIGLLPTDTSPIASLNADYIGFITATGALNHVYVKDGATGLVTKSTGTTLVASTFVDVAFLVRLKTATSLDLHIFVDGAEVSSPTETATEIPENESLTFTASTIAGDAQSLDIDRVEINNYIG